MKAAKVSSIDNPSVKDLLNIEHWALMNNLYVHPAFFKAARKRQKLLIGICSIAIMLITIISILIQGK